ncbi:MAG: LamG domain-containing protein [Deltaproteobacteria bacterium]|nr:LamG domain-containing protein [Deltaproteobacteria bacterium]
MNGTTFKSGKVGQAFSFDGEDDYVNIPASVSLDITETITISAWVLHNGEFEEHYPGFQTILAKGDSTYRLSLCSQESPQWWNCNGHSFMFALSQCPDIDLPSRIVPEPNRWYHVVGTYDGSQARIYIDGNLANSMLCSGPIPINSYDVGIGENTEWTERHWPGQLDEVQIYNRALSAKEIQTIYFGE